MRDFGGSNRLPKARPGPLSGIYAVSAIALLSAIPTANAAVINVIDVIPNSDSAEAFQSSEPSLAVNPLNTSQMLAGSFGGGTPFFKSTNGGTIWTDYGNLSTNDKSLAWRQDGVAALATTLQVLTVSPAFTSQIQTFQGTIAAANFGAPINNFNPTQGLDQPWIRTGPSGQTYVTYNNLDNTGGRTASVRVSSNNGGTFGSQIILDRVGGSAPDDFAQDAPSVRTAVSGSTVYAAFVRFNTVVENDPNTGARLGSELVVVKSANGGADNFTALGSGGNGVTAANIVFPFNFTNNNTLSLGQERVGSDVAIAVDPNNANHVVIASVTAPGANGANLMQVIVAESTDGGATWATKFTTSAAVRSALPALSILTDGAIGLLYAQYDPATDQLSQHLLATTDDFATTTDSLLGTQSNATPAIVFDPYIGDFYDLTSVDDTFFGTFSASNADNGTDALFPSATFQRNFIGTPGTAGFALSNLAGNPVSFSIDPYVFSFTLQVTPAPEPATLTLLATALLGLAALRRRERYPHSSVG